MIHHQKLSTLFIFLFVCLSVTSQEIDGDAIQKTLDKTVKNKLVYGTVLSIHKSSETQTFSAGNLEKTSSYFIASITKLYTSAIIFKLIDEGKLALSDQVSSFFPNGELSNLHVIEGIDQTKNIKIKHLISNTSGLPDYFEEENESGLSIKEHLIEKGDTALNFYQIIEITKSLPPHFIPGEEGKAFYSDINFQILGEIIEKVTEMELAEAFDKFIFNPLGLSNTYLYQTNKAYPSPFYAGNKKLIVPKMMESFKPDGAVVSTAEESMVFLKAFFDGALFNKEHLHLSDEWNKIYPPFQYGIGLMKFKFPGLPALIGHAGASGSFAYYIPSEQIFITGTLNQLEKPSLAYKLIGKVLKSI